ncbi:Protein required for attachment to host cells [Bosea sp. OK403]|uniref:baeRF12 domain-containing protein n=1 Tax=Bosea sp. OK403 TaxID=1855286 RepID=UPI0008E851CF|nr:host attachment protein [Bosea sp. OK403]SFJ86620.1 Protein required for attachment to host cells [Bosea sp. OK403]
MQLPHAAVIALVDGKRFELFRNSGNEAGPVLAPMMSPDLDEHGKGGGAGRDSSSANPTGHQIDEDAHAAAAVGWLNKQVTARKIERLVIVAAPRTLGEMRLHYHKQLQAALVAELSKDLVGKSGPEILVALRGK